MVARPLDDGDHFTLKVQLIRSHIGLSGKDKALRCRPTIDSGLEEHQLLEVPKRSP
jgi:hypothetical protein